jgi:hypothetical protein
MILYTILRYALYRGKVVSCTKLLRKNWRRILIDIKVMKLWIGFICFMSVKTSGWLY